MPKAPDWLHNLHLCLMLAVTTRIFNIQFRMERMSRFVGSFSTILDSVQAYLLAISADFLDIKVGIRDLATVKP